MNNLLIKLDVSKLSIQDTVRHGFIFLCTVVLVFSNFYPRVEATDTILLNAKVYTVNPIQPWASAVAIQNGQITYVGDDLGARELIDSNTQVVNLKGQMILPGFHDIHVHPVHSGVSYQQCALFDIQGVEKHILKCQFLRFHF